jgi:hypothetical protein
VDDEGCPAFDQLGGQVQGDGDGMSQSGAHPHRLGSRVTIAEGQPDRPYPSQVQVGTITDRPVRLSSRFTHSAVTHSS